jgi:N,N'-diacetyllegionaminate synthase
LNPQVMIGSRAVGVGCEPFVVAEVGINHNGDLDRAMEMIHVAKEAGCDAVKFQTFKAEEFVNDPSQMFTYRSQGREVTESMLVMFQRYELPESSWPLIKAECENTGIMFFSTPQNRTDLDILLKVGVPAVKVGSDDFTNLPLLKSYAESGLPLILSTGMSDLADAYQALDVVGGLDGYPVILLVCTSQYPTPPDDANLRRITALRGAFPMVPIGFSDHTSGPLASSLAVALGAVFLEKHFTLSHDLPGPDHWFSEDPAGLQKWVFNIKTSSRMLGGSLLRPTHIERINKLEYQRRLVAAKNVHAGDIIGSDDIILRRVAAGKGLPPGFLQYLIGKPAPRSYLAGDPIEL